MSFIRNPKDFWSGVLFIAFGLAAVIIARDYAMGTAGRMGPGDVTACVLILISLYQPLNVLGFAYREIRQSFIDMEAMLDLSRFLSHITEPAALLGPDGQTVPLPMEAFQVLVKVVELMRAGKAITVAPLDQRLTTQEKRIDALEKESDVLRGERNQARDLARGLWSVTEQAKLDHGFARPDWI